MALFWTSGYIVGALATAHTPALTVGGLLLALLGVGGLASGTLVQRHRVGAVDPRSANTIQLAASAVSMAVVAGIGPGFSVPLTYAALAPIVWLTLGLSICAILLFFWLLRRQKGGGDTVFGAPRASRAARRRLGSIWSRSASLWCIRRLPGRRR